ncbi:MAG TPA: serine/threonine-protein kinase, partial [Gemmatirosa sp.]
MPATSCTSCGVTAAGDARFCSNCAASLTDATGDALFTRVRTALAHEYELQREIGRGAMAVVFLARELTPRRMVAIKVLRPELADGKTMPKRFLAVAQTAAVLEHPNIVTIFRVGEAAGLRYVAMRYIDGASLEQLLLGGGRLPVRLACYVLAEMARALDFAHGQGIVHGEVKPGNVLLDRRWGRAVMTDFGIADVADDASLTRTGLTTDAPYYLSPERCLGFAPTSASDQYALGVVAYQLLTGAPTFGGTPLDVENAQLREAPRPLRDLCPDCPTSLDSTIRRMLEKAP